MNVKPFVISLLFSFATFAQPSPSRSAPVQSRTDQTNAREPEKADQEELAQTLQAIADHIRANYEKIRTWQGRASVPEVTNYWDEKAAEYLKLARPELAGLINHFQEYGKAEVVFYVDTEKNSLYTSFEGKGPPEFYYGDRERLDMLVARFHQRTILTPDRYMHIQPNIGLDGTITKEEGGITRAAIIEPTEKAEGQQWGSIVDPRKFFEYGGLECHRNPAIPAPIYEVLSTFAEQMETFGRYITLTKTKDDMGDDQYRLLLALPTAKGAEPELFQEMIFSGRVGFNLTQVKSWEAAPNRKLRDIYEWTYEKNAGVFLPKTVRRRALNKDGFRVNFDRTITFVESVLNKNIPPETFTYKNLGLRNGDRVIDHIGHIEYTFVDGELKKAVEKLPRD